MIAEDQFMKLLQMIDSKLDNLAAEVRLNNMHHQAEIEQLKKNNLTYSACFSIWQANKHQAQKMN
jgi:hypothetical protein